MKKLLVVLLLLIPRVAIAQVAVDAAGASTNTHDNGATGSTATSANGTITGAGANRAILAFLMVDNNAISAIDCHWDPATNNEALTVIKTLVINSITLAVAARLNPIGMVSRPVVCTWSGGNAAWGINYSGFTGVDQTALATSFCNMVTNTTAGIALSTGNITTATNNMTVDFTGLDSAAFTIGTPTPQTQLFVDNGMNNQVFGGGTHAFSASPINHGWTANGSASGGAIGIDIAANGAPCSAGTTRKSGLLLSK